MTQIDADKIQLKITGKLVIWLLSCTITIVSSVAWTYANIMNKLNEHDQLFTDQKEIIKAHEQRLTGLEINEGKFDVRIINNSNLINELQNKNQR